MRRYGIIFCVGMSRSVIIAMVWRIFSCMSVGSIGTLGGRFFISTLFSAGGKFSLRQGEQVEGERDGVSWRGGVK